MCFIINENIAIHWYELDLLIKLKNVNCAEVAEVRWLLGFKATVPLRSTKVKISSGDACESCHNVSYVPL